MATGSPAAVSTSGQAPPRGGLRGVIGRAQQAVGVLQVGQDFFVFPDVVAAGEDIHPLVQEEVGHLGGDADAAGGVFAVGHHQVDEIAVHRPGQEFFHRPAARGPDDIADEQDIHGLTPPQRAYSTDRVSRMTVTLICPG